MKVNLTLLDEQMTSIVNILERNDKIGILSNVEQKSLEDVLNMLDAISTSFNYSKEISLESYEEDQDNNISTGDKINIIIIENDHGNDDVYWAGKDDEVAKTTFNELKGRDRYCRWEKAYVVGGDVVNGLEFDNNDTVESYFPEDEE